LNLAAGGTYVDPMPAPIDFWFEFASTYSYLAVSRVEQVALAAGAVVSWRPFLLGPIFKAQGWNDSPFNVYPAKGRYMWRDMERLCARYGLPLVRPSQFPRNGLLAARVTLAGGDAGWVPEFVRRTYRANFAGDRDIADAAVLTGLLRDVGADADAVPPGGSDRVKAKLRANTEEAQRLGIFGAPSFVTRGELFWGNDRLEDALAWAGAER
jgi:2-hydroxychromene-2-carboxylate isomerase